MHVVYYSNEYPVPNGPTHGGIATMIRFIAQGLIAQGHTVSVVMIRSDIEDGVQDVDGVQVYSVANNKKDLFPFIKTTIKVNNLLKEIHAKNKIDIIEAPELGLSIVKRLKGVKHVIRMNGGHHFFTIAENRPREWRKVLREKRSFAKADHVIAVSNYVAEVTRKELKLGNIPIEIIPNPVNTKEFYQADVTKVKKGEILFVGTICEKKGVRQLVLAMEDIVKKHPQAQLKIIGGDWKFPDGRMFTDYLTEQFPANAKNNIEIIGRVDHHLVAGYIEQAEVCVYPSHMEALPLAWLEVLSMGKPFVGGSTGPGPEVVNHGETGLLADPHNPKDVAEKVIYMLDHPEEALNMGANARKDVLNRFDIDKLINHNISHYKSLLA